MTKSVVKLARRISGSGCSGAASLFAAVGMSSRSWYRPFILAGGISMTSDISAVSKRVSIVFIGLSGVVDSVSVEKFFSALPVMKRPYFELACFRFARRVRAWVLISSLTATWSSSKNCNSFSVMISTPSR